MPPIDQRVVLSVEEYIKVLPHSRRSMEVVNEGPAWMDILLEQERRGGRWGDLPPLRPPELPHTENPTSIWEMAAWFPLAVTWCVGWAVVHHGRRVLRGLVRSR